MKFRTLILTVYLLALAVYPCSDGSTCSDDDASVKQKLELAQHDHSEDEGDTCSPFCICSCCSVTFRLVTTEVALTETSHHTLHLIPYADLLLLSNSYAIWQPPKLG